MHPFAKKGKGSKEMPAAAYAEKSKKGMHKMPDGKMMKDSDMKKKPSVMAKAMGLMK